MVEPADELVPASKRSRSRSLKNKKESTTRKRFITLKEFQLLMEKDNLDYTLVRPSEIRQRFTEFVIRNQGKVLAGNTSLISANESHYFGNNESMLRSSQQIKKKKGAPVLNESSFMNSIGLKDAYPVVEESKYSEERKSRMSE